MQNELETVNRRLHRWVYQAAERYLLVFILAFAGSAAGMVMTPELATTFLHPLYISGVFLFHYATVRLGDHLGKSRKTKDIARRQSRLSAAG